jgi:hypothetical protein
VTEPVRVVSHLRSIPAYRRPVADRGQATVEYGLLTTVLVVGICLLVRFVTPVEEIGRALLDPLKPDRRPPAHHVPRHGNRAAPRRTVPTRCYCPLDSPTTMRRATRLAAANAF